MARSRFCLVPTAKLYDPKLNFNRSEIIKNAPRNFSTVIYKLERPFQFSHIDIRIVGFAGVPGDPWIIPLEK